MTTTPDITIHKLTPARRADFFRLHAEVNDAGWCFCVAWWVPTWEGWGARTAEENRALRESLFTRGEHDGYLLYVDGEPAGWCQVGLRDRLEKLRIQFVLQTRGDTHAITCFFIAPAYRRRGLASLMLKAVLDELRAQGGARVEAFPKRSAEDAGELWNGAEAMFAAAGFVVVQDDPVRPVMALVL